MVVLPEVWCYGIVVWEWYVRRVVGNIEWGCLRYSVVVVGYIVVSVCNWGDVLLLGGKG